MDRWAIAATLESFGFRDVDAKERFGADGVFVIAAIIYHQILWTLEERGQRPEPPPKPPEPKPPFWARLKLVILRMLGGSFFALPMIGQILCIILTRYSLWASLDFTETQATVIGIGTVGSFAVTGGFVMMIGRQGTVYLGGGAIRALRDVCRQFITMGFSLTITVALLIIAGNMLIPHFTWGHIATVLGYFITLSILWLALGMLFMLALHYYSIALTMGAGLVVHALVQDLGWSVEIAQLSSIVFAAAGAMFIGFSHIKKRGKEESIQSRNARKPPPDVQAGLLLPFAFYGLLYFGFLFLDRLLTWSAPGRDAPAGFWFDTAYELGMDWALMSLLLPTTYLEHVIYELSANVTKDQETCKYNEVDKHQHKLLWFWRRSIGIVLCLSFVSVLLTYLGVKMLKSTFTTIKEIQDFFANPNTEIVYWVGAMGFQFLTLGLLAGLVFFTLARWEPVVRSMYDCFFFAAATGFVLSRFGAPHWSAIGFSIGALVFAYRMMRGSDRLFKRVDYYFFSAF